MRTKGPLTVTCPRCGAPPGRRCRSIAKVFKMITNSHPGRARAARELEIAYRMTLGTVPESP
jgi:hypothetical protein